MKTFRKNLRNSAFTLLELIVVLAIIVVMSSMGIPSLRQTLSRAEFREGTVMLQTELQKTRLLAMKTGVPYVFHFQTGTGIYQILPKEDYIKIYQQNKKNALGTGGTLFSSDNGGENSFDGTAPFEEAEPESDNPDNENPTDLSSDFNPSHFNSENANLSDTTPAGSRFSGSLNAPTNENLTDQNRGAVNSMIQAEGDFDSSGQVRLEGSSLPTVTRELPGQVLFDGITISAATPSGFNNSYEESGSPMETGVSRFSGTLGTPSESVNERSSESESPNADSIPLGRSETNGNENSSTDGSISSETQSQIKWGEPILFYSNGRTSHAVIHLKNFSGGNFWHSEIALRGLTGAARINYIESR